MPFTPKPRPLIFIPVAAVCGILACVGLAVPLYTYELAQGPVALEMWATLWKVCTTATVLGNTQTHCLDLDEVFGDADQDVCGFMVRWRVMRAGGIIAVLAAFVGAVPAAVVDLFAPGTARARVGLMTTAAFILMVSSVTAWATFLSVWELQCLGAAFAKSPGYTFGPMAPLFNVVSMIALGMHAIALTVPGADDEPVDEAEGEQLQPVPVEGRAVEEQPVVQAGAPQPPDPEGQYIEDDSAAQSFDPSQKPPQAAGSPYANGDNSYATAF